MIAALDSITCGLYFIFQNLHLPLNIKWQT